MSDTCGNCDCADKSQCTKKRNGSGVEIVEITEKTRFNYDMDNVSGENDCKCGPSCNCNDCTCGH